MAGIHLEIITPERKAFSEDVDSVFIPGIEGELGALPNHIPLMTMMEPGELQVKRGSTEESLAVGEGFVEISGSEVIILTDMALTDTEIDESAVEEALKRAEKALEETDSDSNPEEAAALMASIRRSVAQLKLKRRRHV